MCGAQILAAWRPQETAPIKTISGLHIKHRIAQLFLRNQEHCASGRDPRLFLFFRLPNHQVWIARF
jgi:hypothetical protein